MLLLLFLVCAVAATRRTRVASVAELRAAVAGAAPDDVIELAAPGEYVLDAPLVFDVPRVELRSVAGGARAVLRAGGGASVLLDVRASDVALRDLIVGRAASGDAARRIDVLVDAGTYTGADGDAYAGDGSPRKRSLGSLVALARASSPVPTRAAAPGANRALRNFALQNVDFSASRAAVNLAFGAGAYVGASIDACVFAAHAASAAIVASPAARFADWRALRRNVFDAAPLRAAQLTAELLARNYWTPAAPQRWSATYCADRSCALLAPVADGARPAERAYASVAAALAANVGHVLVTAAEAPLGASVNVTRAGTLLEGRAIGCNRPTIAVGVNETIVSEGGALVAVRDVRFRLHAGAGAALAYTSGGAAADVELARVAFVGDGASDTHCALDVAAPHVRFTVRDSLFAALATGVALGGGALTVADSSFVGHSAAAIRVRGSGVATGLSVAGSLFVAAPHGALVYEPSVQSARLAEFYVGCSRFVDAPLRAPADCAGACAGALAHNTLIERADHERALPHGRALARGANHVERVGGSRGVDAYVRLALGATGGAHWFSLADHQGRLAAVRAAVTGLEDGAFMLASYVPMRAECFDGSLPADAGAAPRVVSNVWELATDAPRECIAVELQFAVADVNATAHDAADLSVRAPTHIDAASATEWASAAVADTRATLRRDGALVRAAAARGALQRAAVLAAHANERERAAAIETGSTIGVLSVQRAERQLCVVCGGAELPAHALDERCGGDAGALFSDFDAALAAANDARATGQTVSLLVHGDACESQQCTLLVNNVASGELTIEGLSAAERGAIRRPAACAAEHPAARVGPGVTLRYLTLAPQKTDAASAVPRCVLSVNGAARVAFSALAGGVCVADAVAGELALFGNEIEPARGEPALVVGAGSRVLAEGNTLGGAGALVRGAARLDSNAVRGGALRALGADAELTAVANRFDARDATGDAVCVSARDGATLGAVDNEFGAHCELEVRAAGRVRVTGGRARQWRDVRLSVTGSRDVRVSQATLLGRNAAIGVLDGADSAVVLHDVALDLAHTTLADMLVGGASPRSACAAAHEAALGGFALDDSLLVHASTSARLLAHGAPKAVGSFIDPLTGDVRRCGDAPSAAYCACVAPRAASSVAVPPRRGAVAEAPKVRTASVDSATSSTALRLLPLWIALGILLLCAVGACIFYATSRAGTTTMSSAASAVSAAAADIGYTLAVNLDDADDAPLAAPSAQLRHRASHRRRGQQ